MTPAEFVALCDRMSPDAQLAALSTSIAPSPVWFGPVVLTPIGVERIGYLLRDVEQIANH